MGELAFDKPWRLALVVDDPQAIKVAAAYYALPKKRRGDLDAISAASGVAQDVGSVLHRLEIAGLLGASEPPQILVQMINRWVADNLKK